MSKFNRAIEALQKHMMEIGGKLYTLELAKKDENGLMMMNLFGDMLDINETNAEFKEIIEAIKYLRDAE